MGSLLPLQCRFVGLARALHVLQKWSPCLRRCRWHRMQTPVLKILFSLTPKHIQEGLSPGHLKKAKLMFFFTRYPSSSLLKAYFPDVQFNRCITSQMIKWFSNFREFYYIQMEKYARQALSDGITNAQALAVLRDSELFRVLNTHYNKGNDFEVRHALGPMRSKMCILRMVGRWQS